MATNLNNFKNQSVHCRTQVELKEQEVLKLPREIPLCLILVGDLVLVYLPNK